MQSASASTASEEAEATRICKKCKVSFPTNKVLHQHLQTCGKEQQHCRCAAVEEELKEIKDLLAEVLISKRPKEDSDLISFKETKKGDSETLLKYISRLESLFLQLPISTQYQRTTRWQLYEQLRILIPKIFEEKRKDWDKVEVFELFDEVKEEIKAQEKRRKVKEEERERERTQNRKLEQLSVRDSSSIRGNSYGAGYRSAGQVGGQVGGRDWW